MYCVRKQETVGGNLAQLNFNKSNGSQLQKHRNNLKIDCKKLIFHKKQD